MGINEEARLVAPNPQSVTIPVHLVWNSSRVQGDEYELISTQRMIFYSIQLELLLRFRKVHVVLGNIKKIYNSVWLEEREVQLYKFLWKDNPDEEIHDDAINRVNTGDWPAG